ncbi:MAG: hypothetical protein CSA11_01770 [Chloroflexi bacterium]|nr:MAG: hypothetical protein CSA11_01770 [Chloroflexota bacterium]
MLKHQSIKSLYVPALAEGEGVGTAYEYFAKRLVLAKWLKKRPFPQTILIAGLPEKYGSSLDFLLLAEELHAAVTIVDERPFALEKLERGLSAAQHEGWLTAVSPQLEHLPALDQDFHVAGAFDLVISSEVLQRLSETGRKQYGAACGRLGTAVALFAPNADNAAHANLSGLATVQLDQIRALFTDTAPLRLEASGYIDMPPFPPGMVRSDAQREQATSGTLEAVAMWGLGYYARMEQVLPTHIRRRQSHIVYGLGASP